MERWIVGNRSRKKANLLLDDPTVSGVHAELTRVGDGRYRLRDRDSMNGITRYENGRWVRITDSIVLPGDRLRFGRAETTIGDLLKTHPPRDETSERFTDSTFTWTQDFIDAFGEIRSLSQIGKNIKFALDLLFRPVTLTLICAKEKKPVNPFSFMIFGTMINAATTVGELTASRLVSLVTGDFSKLHDGIANALPIFLLITFFVFCWSVVQYKVYLRFSPLKRSFDDFMRVVAVVNGMFFAASGLVAMNVTGTPSGVVQGVAALTLSLLAILYSVSHSVMVQKYFWRIGYARTVLCFVASVGLSAILAFLVIAVPVMVVVSRA